MGSEGGVRWAAYEPRTNGAIDDRVARLEPAAVEGEPKYPQVIAERIERAARAIGDPTRVMAGTDCGFDTSAGMGRVAGDVAWAKLAAMADGAKLASDRLL